MLTNDTIDCLITRFLSGEALPEEAMALADWLAESPEHSVYFNTCSSVFGLSPDITDGDAAHSWSIVRGGALSDNPKTTRGKILFSIPAIAASVILAVLLYLVIQPNHRAVVQPETSSVPALYVAETSAVNVKLPDKTAITVEPGSRLTIGPAYGVSTRRVTLTGSASFSIVHDAARPFIVDMNKFHVKDIGTAFQLRTSPAGDTISIRVTAGEIEAYDDSGAVVKLRAGEKAIYLPSRGALQVVSVNADQPAKKNDTIPRIPEKKKVPYTRSGLNTPDSNSYPLDAGYMTAGQQAARLRDSVQTVLITADLVRDKLILSGEQLSFRLSDSTFLLNGKTQSETIFRRYHQKYAPVFGSRKNWVWSHNLPEPE